MALANTETLSDHDSAAAEHMLRNALAVKLRIVMLVFGTGAAAANVATMADELCEKTQLPTGNLRHVVWVPKMMPAVSAILAPIVGPTVPRVAVLTMDGTLATTIPEGAPVDRIILEQAFVDGGL